MSSYKTTFRKIDGKVTARVWDCYLQSWRLFVAYADIPIRVRASLSQLERDLLQVKLS